VSAALRTLGRDGKSYPRYVLDPREREYLRGRVHYLRHADGLTLQSIVAVLREEHPQCASSVGTVSQWLRSWRCDHCPDVQVAEMPTPERGVIV
jgi:hypothetical protein